MKKLRWFSRADQHGLGGVQPVAATYWAEHLITQRPEGFVLEDLEEGRTRISQLGEADRICAVKSLPKGLIRSRSRSHVPRAADDALAHFSDRVPIDEVLDDHAAIATVVIEKGREIRLVRDFLQHHWVSSGGYRFERRCQAGRPVGSTKTRYRRHSRALCEYLRLAQKDNDLSALVLACSTSTCFSYAAVLTGRRRRLDYFKNWRVTWQ